MDERLNRGLEKMSGKSNNNMHWLPTQWPPKRDVLTQRDMHQQQSTGLQQENFKLFPFSLSSAILISIFCMFCTTDTILIQLYMCLFINKHILEVHIQAFSGKGASHKLGAP